KLTRGRDFHERISHVFQTLLHPRLTVLPTGAAKLIQRSTAFSRAIARQHVKVLDRHEQLVAAVINQLHAIMCDIENSDGLEPLITPDAVIGMHHEITGIEIAKFKLELRCRPAFAGWPHQTVAKNILL